MQFPLFKAKSEWCMPTEFPDLSKYDEYEFKVKLADGGKRSLRAKPSDGELRVDINEFCTSIS